MNQESAGHCLVSESSFRIESLPFSSIPSQSKLFLRYQSDPSFLQKFYPTIVSSHAEIPRKIEGVLANYQTDRKLLCDALEDINKAYGAGAKTLENIERLRKADCVTVVTGQQAGLFSGALYTIYKALSAVKLADCLGGRGINAVPVFWIAEEDHDFDEVKKTFALDRDGRLIELENTPRDYAENLPVGAVVLDETIGDAIKDFFRTAPATEFSNRLKTVLEESYKPGESYSSAFAKLLARLFENYGLIILSPLDERLKKLSRAVFAEAVERSDEIRERLLARNEELKAEDYGAQVLVEEDFFPFFWFDGEGKRRALKKKKDGKIHAKDTRRAFDLAELAKIARETPENLSPNALLRPVVQDALLPTAVYFGGGAEIAYFAQNSVIYETLKRPVTPILHRQSFTVIEPKHARTLGKYGLDLTRLFEGFEAVLPDIVEKYLNPQTAKIFAEAEEIINTELHRLDRALSVNDPSLAENLATRRRKILYHVGALRTKFNHAQIRRDETINRRLEALFAALLPHRALQERTLGALTYLNLYGLYFLDWIYEAIDLDDKGHRIIYL